MLTRQSARRMRARMFRFNAPFFRSLGALGIAGFVGILLLAPKAFSQAEQEREQILASPTQHLEAYEELRRERLFKSLLPDWSFELNFEPTALSSADLKAGRLSDAAAVEGTPFLSGAFLSFERMVFRHGGLFSLGAELGTFFNTSGAIGNFSNISPGLYSGTPYVQYQAHFLIDQWIVPTVRAGYQTIYYHYKFFDEWITGRTSMPRIDFGAMLFLNMLDPDSAGSMNSEWGLKRCYLTVFYSIAADGTQKDFDLSDHALRAGLRFEF